MQFSSSPQAQQKWTSFPKEIRPKLEGLRDLILKTAEEAEGVKILEETTKWGELSYISNIGSTLRLSWSNKNPEQYGMYYTCTSRLGGTFQSVFPTAFKYDGTRAILFDLQDELPQAPLQRCIEAALRYKKVKDLPDLGM